MIAKLIRAIQLTGAGLALACAAGLGHATTTTVALTAQRMQLTLPDGATVPMWGYCDGRVLSSDAGVSVTTGPGQACGAAWSVGPTITVPAGSDLVVQFTNQLPVSTSLVVLGQLGGGLGAPTTMPSPDHAGQSQTTWPANASASFVPPSQNPRVMSMGFQVGGTLTPSTAASVALGWSNLKAGTYLYESSTLPSLQVPMGLYGVLIVTAAPDTSSTQPVAQAYPGAVKYDADVALLFSEVDAVQNASVDAAVVAAGGSADALASKRFNDSTCAPRCYPAAVNYTPTYFLINGHAYDKTAPALSSFAVAGSASAPGTYASGNVLLRMANAGSRTHVPSMVGMTLAVVAEDGNLAPGKPKLQSQVLLTAGKTHDVLIRPPALSPTPTAGAVYAPAIYSLFDRNLYLSTGGLTDGGMQGFVQVASAGASSGAGALPAAVVPSAVNDQFQVPLNAAYSGNVRVNDIAITSVQQVSPPAHGTLVLDPSGSFIYTPTAGFTGLDTFTYNGNGGSTNTATVSLNVGASGLATLPQANADSYASKLTTKISISGAGVLANDNGYGYPLTAALTGGAGNCGSVQLNANGSFTATRGASSTCSFQYIATNSQGGASVPATVSLDFGSASNFAVSVKDSVDGSAVTDYRWIIQEDLTYKVDPTQTPALGTDSLAVRFHKSHMPVVASGCVGPVSCGTGQSFGGVAADANQQSMPGDVALDINKRYYLSILPADAAAALVDNGPQHTMGGAAFAAVGGVWQGVTVSLAPAPLVPAQLSVYIYEDNAPLNGQNDLNEVGLGGFNIVLVDAVGRSGDPAGQQTYDVAGMPLSNWLLGRPGCPDDQNQRTNGTATNADGNVVGVIYTCPNMPAGYSGPAADYALAGHALIKNLTPGRYDVIAHPGAQRQGNGEVWWQTETLEGTPAQDAFAGVKEPVYFQEFGPPGFHTTIGFVNPDRVRAASLKGAYSITGKITNQRMSRPSDTTLYDSGSYDLLASTTCQVALNSSGGTGAAVAIASCAPDGSFTLTGVAPGSYEIVIWDQWLDQIIQTQAVTVVNQNVAMGNIPVLSWFTQYDQNIFMDANRNGVYDDGETGISNVTMTTRYRDGGISNQTATDTRGNGLLAELFPLFNWYVTEADTIRFKQTGVSITVDGGGQVDIPGDTNGGAIYSSKYATNQPSVRTEIPGAYSYGIQSFISQRNTINWGRAPYAPNENGGIQGVVVYSSTRPFDDQRLNVQTIWEPLVPRVQVNLYRKEVLPDGTPTLTKVDSTLTSSFDDWVGALNPDGTQKNISCLGQLPAPPSTGTGSTPPFNTKQVDPFVAYTLQGDVNRCYDGFHNWNQVQAAPYDGRYNFPSAAYIAAHPLAPCTLTDTTQCPTLVSLPPGQYVVEAITPEGYQIVKEEDKNILNGDAFIAQVPAQFGGITNIFILPDQATLNNANLNNPAPVDPVTGLAVGPQNNATTNLGVTSYGTAFPECVGDMHRVPDYLSLFPGSGLVAPFAGMDRPLCDRKLVNLGDQMQASANFFVYTEVPMAAAGTGIILDDASAEFNALAPDFGEKASVPFVPVSIKDFNGREISRTYSDQWGTYNAMMPSSWLVNPPTPSGYGPNMLVTCMNDPGPIPDPLHPGKMMTDPQYNSAYSNFCYTVPFMPGRTTYLDTPVLPIAAHASGYNPADCEYPNATPAISRVDSSGASFGPFVPVADGSVTLTINALGDVAVPNPAYAGPFAVGTLASVRTVNRHYGFGSNGNGRGRVTVNGVALTITSWSDMQITAKVPAGVTTGELVITADNGRSSVDAVTVTVGGKAPTYVAAPSATGDLPGAIQTAIDAATPGDLIMVNAGNYSELLIMWKPVRLQGVGAASVVINATKYPTRKLELWRPAINSLFAVDATTGNQTGVSQVDPLPGQEITGGIVLLEPSVLGTEQGAGITVLAKNLPAGQCNGPTLSTQGTPITLSNFLCAPSRIDGFSVTGGDAGGGIYVNGWAHNLEISNNRVYGNAGALNGGVRVGIPYLQNPSFPGLVENTNGGISGTPTVTTTGALAGWGFDTNVKVHHNAITKNGTVEGPAGGGGAGGGVSMCTGSDGYSVDHNWVCGNFAAADGGGIGHIGFSQGGVISHNQVLFNQSFQQTTSAHGGGIVVTGEPAPVGATVSPGTGNLSIDANLVRGNLAEAGHGGGVRLQLVNGGDVAAFPTSTNRWHRVTLTNNMITNNVAGYAGGGVSMLDVLNSVIDNNTVVANDSVGIAGVVLTNNVTGIAGRGRPSPAGVSSDITSTQVASLATGLPAAQKVISNPQLVNNILWHNRAFFYSGDGRLCVGNSLADSNSSGCTTLPNQTTTGQDTGVAAYWDIGVLGDSSPTPGTYFLSPSYSVLGNAAAYPNLVQTSTSSVTRNISGGASALGVATVRTSTANGFLVGQTVTIAGVTGAAAVINGSHTITAVNATLRTFSFAQTGTFLVGDNGTARVDVTTTTTTPANNQGGDPMLADVYFNGSRITPEYDGVINPPSIKSLQVASVLDEGNNYVNVRFGPLTLMKPDAPQSATLVQFGDYHLAANATAATSSALDHGTVGVNARDYDGDARPQGAAWDIGADEVPPPPAQADLAVSMTDGVSAVLQGGQLTYRVVVTNNGPSAVTGAALSDTFPASETVSAWSCTATTGSSCSAGGTGNARTGTVNLANAGVATYTAVVSVSSSATGTVVNTATITVPAGMVDPVAANNTASDTDTITLAPSKPALAVLDNFNRATSISLGSNWSQPLTFGAGSITVLDTTLGNTSTGLAIASLTPGNAYWNGTGATLGNRQAAAFTLRTTPVNNTALMLKATGTPNGSGLSPSFIRVVYSTNAGGTLSVQSTTNAGGAYSTAGSFTGFGNLANGDTLSAMVDQGGVVNLWKTTSANATAFIGSATLPANALWTTGGGRIGMQMPQGARVDDFSGATIP